MSLGVHIRIGPGGVHYPISVPVNCMLTRAVLGAARPNGFIDSPCKICQASMR